MKKLLILLLVMSVILSLCACGGPKPETAEKEPWSGHFAAGFSRVDVTPANNVGMAGYAETGEDVRMSQGVLNKIWFNCVALTDEGGNTMLLYALDALSIDYQIARNIRSEISAATGVPVENIVINCTHSHSTPIVEQTRYALSAIEAAQAALADRAAATVTYAAAEVENMSFVRHYTTVSGAVVGSNFGPANAGAKTGHTTEADKEMRILKLEREGKKPILMVNWQGHATRVSTGASDFGRTHRYMISTDYPGFCQDYVEKNYDCHCVLFIGASGNVVTTSAISGEGLEKNPITYGEALGQKVLDIAENTQPIQTGTVKSTDTQFEGATATIVIGALSLGDIGIITAPFEMFDTTSMGVREKSPFKATFVLSQANGSYGYMPTDICFDYDDCYECRHTRFNRGDAERIIDIYADLLNDIHE